MRKKWEMRSWSIESLREHFCIEDVKQIMGILEKEFEKKKDHNWITEKNGISFESNEFSVIFLFLIKKKKI